MGWNFAFGMMPFGDRWKAHRKMFDSRFRQGNISSYQPIQIECAHVLLTDLLESPEDFRIHLRQWVSYWFGSSRFDTTVVNVHDQSGSVHSDQSDLWSYYFQDWSLQGNRREIICCNDSCCFSRSFPRWHPSLPWGYVIVARMIVRSQRSSEIHPRVVPRRWIPDQGTLMEEINPWNGWFSLRSRQKRDSEQSSHMCSSGLL